MYKPTEVQVSTETISRIDCTFGFIVWESMSVQDIRNTPLYWGEHFMKNECFIFFTCFRGWSWQYSKTKFNNTWGHFQVFTEYPCLSKPYNPRQINPYRRSESLKTGHMLYTVILLLWAFFTSTTVKLCIFNIYHYPTLVVTLRQKLQGLCHFLQQLYTVIWNWSKLFSAMD